MSCDSRWLQRFANYKKALQQLSRFIEKTKLNELEEQGLIQAFEYCYELAWNVIKDYYHQQGEANLQGSKDAFRLAYQRGLIQNGKMWMQMVSSRILTSHTYNEDTAKQVAEAIRNDYFTLFKQLCFSLEQKEIEEAR